MLLPVRKSDCTGRIREVDPCIGAAAARGPFHDGSSTQRLCSADDEYRRYGSLAGCKRTRLEGDLAERCSRPGALGLAAGILQRLSFRQSFRGEQVSRRSALLRLVRKRVCKRFTVSRSRLRFGGLVTRDQYGSECAGHERKEAQRALLRYQSYRHPTGDARLAFLNWERVLRRIFARKIRGRIRCLGKIGRPLHISCERRSRLLGLATGGLYRSLRYQIITPQHVRS